METDADRRSARPRAQLLQLVGVAPTLFAALALPGAARAAVDRNLAQRTEPAEQLCATARTDDLDSILELGCVPAVRSTASSEAAEPLSFELPGAAIEAQVEPAVDAAAYGPVWTPALERDADIAIAPYCTAPAQTVLAALSTTPSAELVDQSRLDETASTSSFYALDDFYAALSDPDETDQVAAPVEDRGTEPLGGIDGALEVRLVASDVESTVSQSAAASTHDSVVETPARDSDSRTHEVAVPRDVGPAAESVESGFAESAVEQPASRTFTAKPAEPSVAEGHIAASDTGGRAEAGIQRPMKVRSSPEKSMPDLAHETVNASQVESDSQAAMPCVRGQTFDLISAGPTYCVALPQTITATQSSCVADHEVALGSAMPTYCVAPAQTILAARTDSTVPNSPSAQPTAEPSSPAAQPNADFSERPPLGKDRVLRVPQAEKPAVIDGVLDDSAWRSAAVANRFWISEQQRWPAEQTEVLVVSDSTHLYFGFKVYDREPGMIEALQTRRDASLGFDDQIAIELDPFLNYRSISTYAVNAIGTQNDSDGGGRADQLAWKGDWKAAVARTEYGWSVEIAIPYSILNFPSGADTVGVNFLRYHHRTKEWSRWADVTLRNLPEQRGRLTGLVAPTAGKSQPWTFLPYVLAGRNTPNREGEIRKSLGAAGVDIRYEPQRNVTGVISVLPDFSQLATAVTNINFSYNPKRALDPRPFFQEGSAYFGSLPAYFYPLRMPNFQYGGKLFGQLGGTQFGGLATRAPDGRTDSVLNVEHKLDPTHGLGALVTQTDRGAFRNVLSSVRARGREASGLNYGFDGATTQTNGTDGDGSFTRSTVGWAGNHWSVGATLDRFSTHFFPASGLLDRDLPDTRGYNTVVGYYREPSEGRWRAIQFDGHFNSRDTTKGLLQRRYRYVAGSFELRQPQVRFGLSYTAGPYRPVGARPGIWADHLNDDRYWSATLDLNTRSNWSGYGLMYASGTLGGGEYRYATVFAWIRPTSTTMVNLSSEQLRSFGSYRQTIVSASWNITPRQAVAIRYIDAYYGKGLFLAYTQHVRKNMDMIAVIDKQPELPVKLSVKLVLTVF